MARYFKPRCRAASAISSSVSRPSVSVVWACRSPRISSSSISSGSLPAGGPLEFVPRLAQFGREARAGRAPRRLLPRSRRRGRSPGRPSTRNTPYSLIFRPRCLARPRSTTLWSFEPVKYCRAAPNDSRGTIRRSTWNPCAAAPTSWCRRGPARRPRRETAEAVHHLRRLAGHDQDVQVADRVLAAAIAAGQFQLFDARKPADARARPGRSGRPRPSTCAGRP